MTDSREARMQAVRREWLHAAAQALTWFGILLDATRPRNRIGLPDKSGKLAQPWQRGRGAKGRATPTGAKIALFRLPPYPTP